MDHVVQTIQPFGVRLDAAGVSKKVLNLDVELLRDLFRKHQLVLLRGFDTLVTNDEFVEFCERFGEISIWPFGKILELVEHAKPSDHIFDSSYVPMHWDGMYRPQVAEYQIFRCVSAPLNGDGGRTTFSNTISALKNASTDDKTIWKMATGEYGRKMEFYSSRSVSPIIVEHPHRGYEVIRYNEPPAPSQGQFINPPDLRFTGVADEELPTLHSSLRAALYGPESYYAHQWMTGDIVIADNFSLLHGREKFVSGSPRHLQRIHVLSNPPFDNPALRSYT